jgi:endonuclease-3 related protein
MDSAKDGLTIFHKIASPPALNRPVPGSSLTPRFRLKLKERFRGMNKPGNQEEVRLYYRALFRAWGPQHWWPAETPFEVILGAYLTQNTAWTNVERALANLRSAHALSLDAIRKMRIPTLERLLRPAGYFRQKARRIKVFIAFLDREYDGSLDQLFSQTTAKLREQLLALNGVGPETADSILLYAGNHPVFVVDAYTRRILARHHIAPVSADYEELRDLFERALTPLADEPEQSPHPAPLESGIGGASHPPSPMSTAARTSLVQIYNELHGLIVGVGKHHCGKSKLKCDGCPLQPFLPDVN